MDFSIVQQNLPLFAQGFWLTVQLVGLSLLVGGPLALAAALAIRSSFRPLAAFAQGYVYFFRGTPGLVQIYLIYYGAGQFEALQQSWLWEWFQEPYFCAWLGLTLNTGAYTSEILRGAMANTPRGQLEAAKALGLRPRQIFWLVIWPGTLRRALPAYGNEVIAQLHTSAIVSTITLIDLTGAARRINATHFSPYEAFLPAALGYLLLTMLLVLATRWLEKHFRVNPSQR